MIDIDLIQARFASLSGYFSERGRRLFAATKARAAGYGGIAAVSVVQGLRDGSEALGDVRNHPSQLRMPILPFKLNQDRRSHIPRQQHRVTNWPAYDASLRQRGSLTVWFTDDVIAG